jgi:2-polyprenyl-3-methyl-5-hydroxy-6-metoxy-1,4-benzoquinol methylase
MSLDPVASCQQVVRRAGQRLRDVGVLPQKHWKRQQFEGEELEDLLARGRRQADWLAEAIESYTGCTLEGRRLLDYGCGTGRTALALAARCAHIYGLDIMPGVLRKADETAKQLHVENVEWLDAAQLQQLAGRYDAVISTWVFQHIPTREGEQIFAAILAGLAPGGVGAIHFTVRPPRALAGIAASARAQPERRLRAVGAYGYLLMNSYSLNRLGVILSEAGVTRWQVLWWYYSAAAGANNGNRYPSATLVFRKQAGEPAAPLEP